MQHQHCWPSCDVVHGRHLGGAVIIDAIFVSGLLDPLGHALDELPYLLWEGEQQRSVCYKLCGEPSEKTPIIAIPRGADFPLMHRSSREHQLYWQAHTRTRTHTHTHTTLERTSFAV